MSVDHSMPVLTVDMAASSRSVLTSNKTMIRIIRNLLKQLGLANVDEAGDGGAALDMMRHKELHHLRARMAPSGRVLAWANSSAR